VDEQWKCANDLPTAVDDGGNLVNYVEVSEESANEAVLGWEKGLTSAPGTYCSHRSHLSAHLLRAEDLPPWTSEIPSHLIHAAQLEEQYLARRTEPDAPPPPLIPHPPSLPRHLEKVILNARATGNAASASGVGKSSVASVGGVGAISGAGTAVGGADDNSVLPVPNHVVLNHLGTSAIKGGVLAVGTTTRYHRKVSILNQAFSYTTDDSLSVHHHDLLQARLMIGLLQNMFPLDVCLCLVFVAVCVYTSSLMSFYYSSYVLFVFMFLYLLAHTLDTSRALWCMGTSACLYVLLPIAYSHRPRIPFFRLLLI
jgi:hypothetical protein